MSAYITRQQQDNSLVVMLEFILFFPAQVMSNPCESLKGKPGSQTSSQPLLHAMDEDCAQMLDEFNVIVQDLLSICA